VHAFAAVEANENIRDKLEADEQTTLVAMAKEARRRLEAEQREIDEVSLSFPRCDGWHWYLICGMLLLLFVVVVGVVVVCVSCVSCVCA
jgi:hypothetical protein